MTIQQHEFSPAEREFALCRKDLDFITDGNFLSNGYEECQNLSFFRILGITRFWNSRPGLDWGGLVGDILNSCVRHNIPFAYAVIGDEQGLKFYVGTARPLADSLRAAYTSAYPGIDIEAVSDNPLRSAPRECGGMMTGIPTGKLSEEQGSFQIANLCRGMAGRRFTYVILARGISSVAVTLGHQRLLEELETVYPLINQSFSGGAQGNQQVQQQDFAGKNYLEDLETLEAILKIATARGMWRVNGYYAADTPVDAQRLGSLVRAGFSGDESKPEPFRVIEYRHVKDVIANTYMMADVVDNQELHPLGRWRRDGAPSEVSLYIYRFQTLLHSDQLAVLCQLPTQEFHGFYVDDYVEFDVAARGQNQVKEPFPLGEICVAGRARVQENKNQYVIERDDFTRHALIIGITGGGKTNTSKSILNTLWNWPQPQKRVPFLVIESAKREYWELRNLKGFEDLLVFTLGDEAQATSVKYRINPFETNPHISLQTHIDYLLSTFKAAFDLYPPMPYILEKCVYEIYDDRGWDIVENRNRYGLTEYPTLADLYNKIGVIVDDMGYHQEVQSNVKAALQARIYSLMIGGKGAMLNTPRSIPIQELLSRPVVMELEDLGDDETKSFVIGILLVQLYEYRKSQMTKGAKELSHVLMIEEAHRLLKRVTEGGEGGNTQAKSVEFFCNLLAEIRTFGQGILVADQIPTKLAPDTIKNTNLKIVHRTVAAEDRETIGRAMNMSEAQMDYLSSLRRGFAAVYAEGDNKPKCVKFPLVVPLYDKNRSQVIDEVRRKVQDIAEGYDQTTSRHMACAFCTSRCQYYDAVQSHIQGSVSVSMVLERMAALEFQPQALCAFLDTELMRPVSDLGEDARGCALGYILQQHPDLTDGRQQVYIAGYLRYIHKR